MKMTLCTLCPSWHTSSSAQLAAPRIDLPVSIIISLSSLEKTLEFGKRSTNNLSFDDPVWRMAVRRVRVGVGPQAEVPRLSSETSNEDGGVVRGVLPIAAPPPQT
jgi:hypothetical protein